MVGSTKNDSLMSFTTTFDKSKIIKMFKKELVPQATSVVQKHIKKSIREGILRTRSEIISIRTKNPNTIAPNVIANSLQAFGIKQVNQHIRYKVGSYSNTDRRDKPTGAKGSRMRKNDKSLTELYENGSSRFRQEGTIGAGSSSNKGHVGKGRPNNAGWKRTQEMNNKIVVSEKGYGKGVPYASKNKSGRGVPMIWHPGYEKLQTLKRLRENINRTLQDDYELKRGLEKIRMREDYSTPKTKMKMSSSGVMGKLKRR